MKPMEYYNLERGTLEAFEREKKLRAQLYNEANTRATDTSDRRLLMMAVKDLTEAADEQVRLDNPCMYGSEAVSIIYIDALLRDCIKLLDRLMGDEGGFNAADGLALLDRAESHGYMVEQFQ